MKKIYVSPKTVLQKVELVSMIATSNLQSPQNFSFDPNATAENGKDILSRQFNIWGSEEEEEE